VDGQAENYLSEVRDVIQTVDPQVPALFLINKSNESYHSVFLTIQRLGLVLEKAPLVESEKRLMNGGKTSIEVAVEQKTLAGSGDELQKVATVYINGDDFTVYAPTGAVGDALEWIDRFRVRQLSKDLLGGEVAVDNKIHIIAIESVRERLEQMRDRSTGLNPDEIYCNAQNCLQGHVTERIIAELEAERDRLDAAITALRDSARKGKRRRLSVAARKRISDAQKKRWAASKRVGRTKR
jgi:hypothetical protein